MWACRIRWLLLGLVMSPLSGFADEAGEPVAAAPDEVASVVPQEVPHDEAERRRTALIGLSAVAGIAILGIGLVAVIVIWAGRLRRINRKPLPEASLKDELWFLKPPKSPPEQGPPSVESPP
jgi:hypothetical protein